jgi:ABC-type transport system involved in cytochrome bd biosynthesis fused ATPase/permease subunit
LALLLFGMFSLAGAVIPFSARHFARPAGSRMVVVRASLQAQLVDAIHGMADILAFARLAERQARLQESGVAYASAQRATARVGALHSGLSLVAVNAALWLTLILGIPLVNQASIRGIMLASVALVVLASFEAVVNLPLAGQLWPAMQAATSRILEIVNVAPCAIDCVHFPPQCSSLAVPQGGGRSLEIA